LFDDLTGAKAIARFTKEERTAAIAILKETKPGVPAYWTAQ
jgi:hypothetical protein